MATHDYVIANGTGQAVRSDINNALAAIVSNNSSSSEPGTTYAYQWWADTNANVLKLRNSANDAWITLRELDGTMLIEDGSAASPGLAFADDTNTGIFSPAADNIALTTGGGERLRVNSTESVFNEDSNSYDFRVESNGDTHMLFVDGSADAVGIGVSSPVRPLHVDGTAFVSGTAPQLRLNGGAGDSNDDDRAMFGLATTSGHFFGGAAAGDAVLRTTNGGNLLLGEGTTETVRIDSSGRVGVGTTPEAWSGFDVLEVNEASIASSGSGDAFFAANAYYDGAWKYKDAGVARNIYMNADGIVFRTAASGSADAAITWTEVGRWREGGGLCFNGDTAAANGLDDYEEGTWTPTFVNAGTGTYIQRTGKYTKIGNVVHISLHMQLNSVGTASGTIQISGLPFTSSNSPNNIYGHSSSVHGTGWSTARTSLNALLSPAQSTITTLYYNMAGATGPAATHADIGTGNLLFNMQYTV